MIKKIITLIITISYIVACNGPCYGFGARTLFQHKSHAQRNLESIDSYKDVTSTPSFLSIPQNLGRIVEYHKGKGSALIVHIQDRHVDSITQKNIASIIETLNQQYNIHLICLEGASEELDTSFYDSFKDTPLKENIARFFVEKALFTGAEFYKITNRANYLRAVGVEDKGIYLEHLANYKNNQASKSAVLNLLRSLRVAADNLQNYVYSKDLKDLDGIARAYLDGRVNFSEYISRLKACATMSGTEIKVYPNLEKFIKLAEREKAIDFEKAKKDREALIKYLSENLRKEEARELLQMSLDFRLNKLSEIAFYDYLESLITDYKLQATDYKDLFAYIDYLRFSKAINHLEVFDEAESLEERVQAALCENSAQRELVRYSKAISMLRDLYNLKLTHRRLDYMKENARFFDITKMRYFLKERSGEYGLRIAAPALFTRLDRGAIEESKKFYALALERDIALTENTLKSMKQYHKDKAVLIAGGFHTQGITNILKEKDISYVVICPAIGPGDCEKLYNDRMQGLLPDISVLKESFAHMLSAPLYTGGIADKALSRGVQERFAALLDTDPEARLSIEEKQLTKGSSAGRVITVARDKSVKLPAQSPDRLRISLGPCFAVAIFNQKTGEGYLSHLFPVVAAKQLSRAVEQKQRYFDRVIGHVKGDEWNVAVIGSDTSLDIFPLTDRRIILEDIVIYLQKNGAKNIQVDPQFTKKVVSFDSTGKIAINLLEHRNIQYAIDLGAQKNSLTGSTTVANVVEKIASKGVEKSGIAFKWLNAQRMVQLQHIIETLNSPSTQGVRPNFAGILAEFIIRKASQGADHIRPVDAPAKASSSGTLSEGEKQKAESMYKHMLDIHRDNFNSRTGYGSYLIVEYSKDNVRAREENTANPYFYPVHFAKEFSKFVDNTMDLSKQRRLLDYVLEKMQQEKWADIFWQVYADYKKNTHFEWYVRDIEPEALEEKLIKILPIKSGYEMQDKGNVEGRTGIAEYIINKEVKDTLRETKKEISDFHRARVTRNFWLIRDVIIYESVYSFQEAIQKLHAVAAKTLRDTCIVNGLSQPRMITVENDQRAQYFPEPQHLDQLMDMLAYRVIHDASFKSRHVILQAAEIFLRIMDMQYFTDGNRRVARLMANYHLMLNNYPQIFVDNEDEYINILRFMRVPEELADFIADEYLSRQKDGKWNMDELSGAFILNGNDKNIVREEIVTVDSVISILRNAGEDKAVRWIEHTTRIQELEQIIEGLDGPDALLLADVRSNMADILADFVIRKALADADHLRPFDLRPKTSSSGTRILSEELSVDINEALNHYIAPLYDPLSYLGLGRVTFITNARSFTEVDKRHLRRLAAQNRGLSDDDPKKITIVTVYGQAKAALKDCGFTDKGKRPSVLSITDFDYLSDIRWQEIAQSEQIAMIAASIRGQNRAVITITNDKVAGGIASTMPQYLNDRKKGKIIIASMRGATQRTKIGSDTIEENEIMFSAVLAYAAKEAGTQLRENTDQQLFILEALPPIDSMAFEKFIKSLMDTKAAIDATASAA